jgi:hypothetical protein
MVIVHPVRYGSIAGGLFLGSTSVTPASPAPTASGEPSLSVTGKLSEISAKPPGSRNKMNAVMISPNASSASRLAFSPMKCTN